MNVAQMVRWGLGIETPVSNEGQVGTRRNFHTRKSGPGRQHYRQALRRFHEVVGWGYRCPTTDKKLEYTLPQRNMIREGMGA